MNKGFLLITLALASGYRDSSMNTVKLYPSYMQMKIIFWYVKKSLDVKKIPVAITPNTALKAYLFLTTYKL